MDDMAWVTANNSFVVMMNIINDSGESKMHDLLTAAETWFL